MHKLNLKATFRLIHLKFTGSRIIVISRISFMKMNGLIFNYILEKKISNWLRKCKIQEYLLDKNLRRENAFVEFFTSFMQYKGGWVSEGHDVYKNIVLDM